MALFKKPFNAERAAKIIKELTETGLSRDAAHAVEQHPELQMGLQLFEGGSKKPASRGSGPVEKRAPAW